MNESKSILALGEKGFESKRGGVATGQLRVPQSA